MPHKSDLWPCNAGRRLLCSRIRNPRASTGNCIFNKLCWLVRCLVIQIEKNWGPERDRDLLMVTEQILWLDPNGLIHSFIRTFTWH